MKRSFFSFFLQTIRIHYQDPELARHFGVMSIPTVVFLKGGREIARKVGVMPEAVYDGLIQENL